MSAELTIQLSDDDEAELRAKAEAAGISLEEAATRYVADRLDYDRWFRAEVQKGIDEIEAGNFFTHEEVVERAAARRASLLAAKSQD